MLLEVEVRAVGDALELAPAEGEVVLEVLAAAGVVGELVATALLVLVAGFETTVNLIGNGTVALLSEPGTVQWRALAADPALAAGAVEELLRYDSPAQMTSRIATEDTEVDGARSPRAPR